MGEKRNEYTILIGKPEGRRPLRRPRYRWEDNIEWEVVDWMHLAQSRNQWRALVNTVTNVRAL
jgi:hypothetical protein